MLFDAATLGRRDGSRLLLQGLRNAASFQRGHQFHSDNRHRSREMLVQQNLACCELRSIVTQCPALLCLATAALACFLWRFCFSHRQDSIVQPSRSGCEAPKSAAGVDDISVRLAHAARSISERDSSASINLSQASAIGVTDSYSACVLRRARARASWNCIDFAFCEISFAAMTSRL